MFTHGLTGKIYRTVREKLKYFKGRENDMSLTEGQREYAKKRVSELTPINEQSYAEPTLIVTDDKKFGNGINKPRLCAVIDEDKRGRILVSPILPRTSEIVILDNDHNRQISNKRKWIDRSDVYETKYIYGAQPLTENDKTKIKEILRKK